MGAFYYMDVGATVLNGVLLQCLTRVHNRKPVP
jgi:hypothetical protein